MLRRALALLGLPRAACRVKRAIQFGSRIGKLSNTAQFGSNRAANKANAGSVALQVGRGAWVGRWRGWGVGVGAGDGGQLYCSAPGELLRVVLAGKREAYVALSPCRCIRSGFRAVQYSSCRKSASVSEPLDNNPAKMNLMRLDALFECTPSRTCSGRRRRWRQGRPRCRTSLPRTSVRGGQRRRARGGRRRRRGKERARGSRRGRPGPSWKVAPWL